MSRFRAFVGVPAFCRARCFSAGRDAAGLCLFLLLLLSAGTPAHAQDAATVPDESAAALDRRFTYQGRLLHDDDPITGACDVRAHLFDAGSGGNPVGQAQTVSGVLLDDGYFAVTLNQTDQFGVNAFRGEARWLEIAVRCPAGEGSFVTLGPRQALTAAPYTHYALAAGVASNVPWSGITGVPASIANPPTYSAGVGLQLNDGQFRVVFGGSGSSNSAARSNHQHHGQSWSGAAALAGLAVTNTTASGVNFGLYGVSESASGRGVFGYASEGSGNNTGVFGQSDSTDGRGVAGYAPAGSGETLGVLGRSDSPLGRGVYGWAPAATGPTFGVYGRSDSQQGTGVYGWTSAATGDTAGVYGKSDSSAGRGVIGRATAATGATVGVYGVTASNSGIGIFGRATNPNGNATGVRGETASANGEGVVGVASHNIGFTIGVHGWSNSSNGTGVIGRATAGSGLARGVVGYSSSSVGRGVMGYAAAGSGTTFGVYGESHSTTGRGVLGLASHTSGVNYGVAGQSDSPNGHAGYFAGRLTATGPKAFQIDHPLDPENKVLNHVAIESAEILNLYSGNVILDGAGAGVVALPAWFSALNTDFRYQLTPIGAPGPNLYIAAPIQDNRFHIGGGTPGMSVSWQITGVRHDPTAQYYPLVVEEDKPVSERGTYLTPAAFGLPLTRGTHYYAPQPETHPDE